MKLERFIYVIILCKCFTNMNILSFQYSDLMREYYLTCGADYFCLDIGKLNIWGVRPEHSYRHFGLCPDCKCDMGCIRRGDCCPDLFFSFPEMECVNRTIIKGMDDNALDQRYSEFMVKSCPEFADHVTKHKCETYTDIKSRLFNFPVTGLDIPLTFYNRFCAECHGVSDVTEWTLDIKCGEFADFNFLSNLDDVISAAYDRDCIFQTYHPKDVDVIAPNCYEIYEDQTLFSRCNQTGQWVHYDANVQNACESYIKMQYRLFKNIFCYICNPSYKEVKNDIVVSECNTTGQWRLYDAGLQKACVQLPYTYSTRPFKNIFCYLCNRGNETDDIFIDINASISEFVTKDDHFRFQYNISITSFNFEYFEHVLNINLSKNGNGNDIILRPFSETTITRSNGTVINSEYLLSQALTLSSGGNGLCTARKFHLGPGFDKTCTCDPRCFFEKRVKCCSDLALELETTCIDQLELSNIVDFRNTKKGYFVINGCFQERTYKIFRDGCLQKNMRDVYSVLPIHHVGRNVTYNNLYCVLCNSESSEYVHLLNGRRFFRSDELNAEEDSILKTLRETKTQSEQHEIWNLEITCPEYLDYSHILNFGDLLSLAWQQKCRVLYNTTTKPSDVCNTRIKRGCDYIDNWKFENEDMRWACENVINFPEFNAPVIPDSFPNINISFENKTYRKKSKIYPNVFCALCVPTQNFTVEYVDVCNVTGFAKSSNDQSLHEFMCLNAPFIYYFYPFKNPFCAMCNGVPMMALAPMTPPSFIPSYDRAPGVNWFPLLRNLFSIAQDDNTLQDEGNMATQQCTNNQVFDYYLGRCRNITCFAGKYHQGTECQPLLKITKNLRYLLRIVTEITVIVPMRMIDVVLQVNKHINDSVSSSLAMENAVISVTRAKGSESCSEIIFVPNITYIEFNVELFFHNSVNRRDLELKVMNLSIVEVKRNVLLSVRFVNMKDRPLVLNDDSRLCSIARPPALLTKLTNHNRYHVAKASETLLCRQVELSKSEYNISDDRTKLTLTKNGIAVDYNQFDVTPEGHMRVCYDYLADKRYFGHSNVTSQPLYNHLEKHLWVLSLICTIISLICLILGLLVYSIFPVLRTIPGKLIMVLMTALIFTLIFQELSFFMTNSKEGCVAVGIISHFTWLSVFTSMQACNIHMFKVFTSNRPRSNQRRGFIDRALLFYVLYVFTIPFLIIITNIGISEVISKGSLLGYGGIKCFMDNTISVILAFICPVTLICISNILLYIITIRTIHNTPNPEGKDRDRGELSIFVRLASITGISWILQIIDSFLPLTAFSFVATVINSLQGMFVFMAFVLNKRNLKMFRDKIRYNTETHQSTSTSGTIGKLGNDATRLTKSTKL